jgi:HK97 family phage major capsid protein
MWIKFLKDYTQKDADGNEQSFKEGDIVELEETVAKSLITVGFAEKTEEPEDEGNESIIKQFATKVEETVEAAISKALEGVTTKLEEDIPNFATAKGEDYDLEADYGFKSKEHFWRAVTSQEGGPVPSDVAGKDFLFKAPSGQNISNDPEGGFLVPEPIADSIWSNLMDEPASIIPQTLQMTTAGNSMKVPRLFESTRKTGTGGRNAGIISYWVDEAGTLTASKMTTDRHNLELHKLATLVYATSEMLEDSGFSLTGFFNQLAPRSINFEVGNAFFNGTGAGKPQGVLKSDALILVAATDRAGNAVATDNLSHFMISNCYYRNSERSRAIWYGHVNTIQLLEFLYFDDDSTNKRPIYFPAGGMGVGGLTQSPFGVMYGRPVVPMEFMPNKNQQGTLALVDWSDYATLQKSNGGIRFAQSIHVRFLNDETAFRFTFRIDGRSLWTSPREDLNGSTTRSPYTAIAAIDTDEGTSSGL